MDIKMSLKAARVNKGFTQVQAAEIAGVSPTTIVNWESNKSMIPASSLMVLCEHYGVTMDSIFLPRETN